MKPAKKVLLDLVKSSNISVRSGDELIGRVNAAVAADNKAREEKKDELLRRKPELTAIPRTELAAHLEVNLWDVLHTLGRATALSGRGAGRGLAEHWGALKYNQALAGGPGGFLGLTDEGRQIAEQYKNLQSGELGTGFALTLAEHLLRRRFPEHSVTIVPADTALRAGWALTSRDKGSKVGYRYRPQYFAEVWRPGEPSLVVPVACKGNHGNAAASAVQLASASVHAEAVHVGAWNETPALLFSTELPTEGTVAVHALQARGRGGWLTGGGQGPGANHDAEPVQMNLMPGIQPPPGDGTTPEPVPGCQVRPEEQAWFQQTLGHTAAAGLMAFTGSGRATGRHLTERQGSRRFDGFEHAASGSVQDIGHELLGESYAGTDHVFRLNGPRVEAFSGVETELFRVLRAGGVERYQAIVHATRHTRPRLAWDETWGGPVSVHADGSVLAIRLLAGSRRQRG
ncbi:hypothetical protein KUM39_13615 [Streptomyces sp. J2-1]|uniref:hypothetical protein n=1 Tax=Streptomyces corallincola TaxID=2851888 RepID=UPI001C38120F|nr:hypothetical protein [Streptomyces corallincola]MBV2355397.1 hypothetical protein [Streptomyces corallincola]